MRNISLRSRNVLALAVVVSMALAGCHALESTDKAHDFGSFDEASSAAGATFHPEDDDASEIRLKLLVPTDPDAVPVGEDQDLVLLLYKGDAPITDATFDILTWMPAHDGMDGHGTGSEKDPVHDRFGIYVGMTNLVMAGHWELQFAVTIPGEVEHRFHVPIKGVGDADDGHDEHGGMDGGSMGHGNETGSMHGGGNSTHGGGNSSHGG